MAAFPPLLPPAPPDPQSPIKLDAFFAITDSLFSRLSSDIRPEDQMASYTLQVRADQDDFTLSWDLSGLPVEFSSLRLKQVSPVSSHVVELTDQESAAFTALDQAYYRFELILGRKAVLDLSAG